MTRFEPDAPPETWHSKLQHLHDYWLSIHPGTGLPGRQHLDPADLPGLLARLAELRAEAGRDSEPFETHVISMDAFSVDGVRRLEEQGVTDVIVGFRWPYVTGPDVEPLQAKIDSLRQFADTVITKVKA